MKRISLYFGLASGLVWIFFIPLGKDYAVFTLISSGPGLVIALGAYLNIVKEKPWGRDLIKIGVCTLTLYCLVNFLSGVYYGPAIVLIPLLPLITGIISLYASREDEDERE